MILISINQANGAAQSEFSLSIVPMPDKIHYKLISKHPGKNLEIESVVPVRSFWEALTYFNGLGMSRKASVELSGLNGDSLQITRKVTGYNEPAIVHILHTIRGNYAPLKVSYEVPFHIFNALFLQAEAVAQR